MIPSTSITAILLAASLSLRMTSSNRGPALRAPLTLTPTMSLVKCRKLLNALRNRSTNKMIAKIFHPRPLRGGRDGGGVMTGGGCIGGILYSGAGGELLSMNTNRIGKHEKEQARFNPIQPVPARVSSATSRPETRPSAVEKTRLLWPGFCADRPCPN